MKDLLYALVEDLVDDKDSIKITQDEPNEEGVIVLHLSVAPDDMGRVIGKQGRIAKAIRRVVKAASIRQNKNYILEIV